MRDYYVYILANHKCGTLYIGVTNDLIRRIQEHKDGLAAGFTKRYNVHQLVYYEDSTDIVTAIEREKCLKKWRRKWKLELIQHANSEWNDLYPGLIEG